MPRFFFFQKKKSLFCAGCILRAAALSVLLSQTVEFPVRKGKLFLFPDLRLCVAVTLTRCWALRSVSHNQLHSAILLLRACSICISLGLLSSPAEETASQAVIPWWVKQELLCSAGRLAKLGCLEIGHEE